MGLAAVGVLVGGGAALGIEGLFFAANLTKLVHGAWLPLLIALTLFTVMSTWQRGREIVTERRETPEGGCAVRRRTPRTAPAGATRSRHCGLPQPQQTHRAARATRQRRAQPGAPRAGRHRRRRDRAGTRRAADEIATADDLGYRDDGITLITAAVRLHAVHRRPQRAHRPARRPAGIADRPRAASYFLSTIDLEIAEQPSMPRWRTLLFLGTTALAADAALAFELPRDRTVVIGSRISV